MTYCELNCVKGLGTYFDIITGKDTEEILTKFDAIETSIVEFVNKNGLALNLKKTKYMIFSRQ